MSPSKKKTSVDDLLQRRLNSMVQRREENAALAAQQRDTVAVIVRDIRSIPLTEIDINPDQPRHTYEEEGIERLAESIKQHGLLHPINVYAKLDGRFMIISGERRYRAAKLLNEEKIDAIVVKKPESESDMLTQQFIENVQREDMNIFDIGCALYNLMRLTKKSSAEIAEEVGLEKRRVNEYLRVSGADEFVQGLILAGYLNSSEVAGRLVDLMAKYPNEKGFIEKSITDFIAANSVRAEDSEASPDSKPVLSRTEFKKIADKVIARYPDAADAKKGDDTQQPLDVDQGPIDLMNVKKILGRRERYRRYKFLKPLPLRVDCVFSHPNYTVDNMKGCAGAQVLINVVPENSDYALVEYKGDIIPVPWKNIAITGAHTFKPEKKAKDDEGSEE